MSSMTFVISAVVVCDDSGGVQVFHVCSDLGNKITSTYTRIWHIILYSSSRNQATLYRL